MWSAQIQATEQKYFIKRIKENIAELYTKIQTTAGESSSILGKTLDWEHKPDQDVGVFVRGQFSDELALKNLKKQTKSSFSHKTQLITQNLQLW